MDKRLSSVSPQKASPKRFKVSKSPKKETIADTAYLLSDLCFNEEDFDFRISDVSQTDSPWRSRPL